MKSLESLAIFAGTGECNANCEHCAGKMHRAYAPRKDGIINSDLIEKTLRQSYEEGARSLSISSSGEPTLSPKAISRVFEIIQMCKKGGIKYSPINLYSNGIRIGEEKEFCKRYLPIWRNNGLTTIYVTVHDVDEKKNAEVYRIAKYPELRLVVERIHEESLLTRANLVLSKKTIGYLEKFAQTCIALEEKGFDSVSAWPIRGRDDFVDSKFAPSEEEMNKIEKWIETNQSIKIRIRLLREKSHARYSQGQKLTLFPDGSLTNNWCNFRQQQGLNKGSG